MSALGAMTATLLALAALGAAWVGLPIFTRWANHRFTDRDGAPAAPAWGQLTAAERWAVVVPLATLATLAALFGLYAFARVVIAAVAPETLFTVTPDGPSLEAQSWAAVRNGLFLVAAVLGAPFVIWRTVLAAQQTRVQQESHFTDLYAKAVEMLGADKEARVEGPDGRTREPNIEVRLGAIYALERISKQSDADYLPIMDVLCAYVRQNAEKLGDPLPSWGECRETDDGVTGTEPVPVATYFRKTGVRTNEFCKAARADKANSAERPDIAAALNVLARRSSDRRRLECKGDGNYEAPVIAPPKKAPNTASIEDKQAALKQRLFYFDDKRELDFLQWRASGWHPDLVRASLQGAFRPGSKSEPQVDFRRAKAMAARFDGADLQFASFEGADLQEASFTGARLRVAQFQGADLRRARFDCALLRATKLNCANCKETIFTGADFDLVRCEGTDFTGAQFFGVNFHHSWVEAAVFQGAFIVNTDLSDVSGLTIDQLRSCFGSTYRTRLPLRVDGSDVDGWGMTRWLVDNAGWQTEDLLPGALFDAYRRWLDRDRREHPAWLAACPHHE